MPRIKRWFHVSHDRNNDPEVWELTDTFGDRALRVHDALLSISDRNEGFIPGAPSEQLTKSIAYQCRLSPKTVEKIWLWMLKKAWLDIRSPITGEVLASGSPMVGEQSANDWWIVGEQLANDLPMLRGWLANHSPAVLAMRNYAKYIPSREANKIPDGKQLASPPSSPPLTPSLQEETNTTTVVFSESQHTASPNGSGAPTETTRQGPEKAAASSDTTVQGSTPKAPRPKQPGKEPIWPPDGLFVRSFLDRQQYLAPYFSHGDLLCLNDPVWWENLSQAINGLSEEFLEREFALMANWLHDHATRRPTAKGLLRFVGHWLLKEYEDERKKPWLSEKRAKLLRQ